jgi:hypothetical protein
VLAFLKQCYRRNELCLPGAVAARSQLRAFHSLLHTLFDPDESAFNVHSPHHVARWNIGHALPEVWNRDRRSQKLEKLLFEEREITRRLRTSAGRYAHVKLNLVHEGRLPRAGRSLPELCAELKKLV